MVSYIWNVLKKSIQESINNIGIAKYLIEHGADIHVKQDMPIKMINALEKDNKEGDLEWLKTYLHS